jgi:hypothetical protein
MKRICATAVVVVLAWGLAVPAGAATGVLRAKVLKVSELPKGWLAAGASTTALFGCPASSFPTHSSAKVAAGFTYLTPKSFPLLTEVLATFSSSTTAYNALEGGLAGCAHVSGTLNGKTLSGTVTKMAFTKYGNQSTAFVGRISVGGSPIVVYVLVVRKSKELMEIEEANFTSLSLSGFRSIAATAATKL